MNSVIKITILLQDLVQESFTTNYRNSDYFQPFRTK